MKSKQKIEILKARVAQLEREKAELEIANSMLEAELAVRRIQDKSDRWVVPWTKNPWERNPWEAPYWYYHNPSYQDLIIKGVTY